MAGPLADFVVSLNTDGHIISQGSVSDALAKDSKLVEEIKHEEEAVELVQAEEATADKAVEEKKGKLVVAEEIAQGHVSWHACKYHSSSCKHSILKWIAPVVKLFLTGLGGKYPFAFWIGLVSGIGLSELFDVMEVWWLGYWARQYTLADPSSVSVP
jgi:hypothetical protein